MYAEKWRQIMSFAEAAEQKASAEAMQNCGAQMRVRERLLLEENAMG